MNASVSWWWGSTWLSSKQVVEKMQSIVWVSPVNVLEMFASFTAQIGVLINLHKQHHENRYNFSPSISPSFSLPLPPLSRRSFLTIFSFKLSFVVFSPLSLLDSAGVFSVHVCRCSALVCCLSSARLSARAIQNLIVFARTHKRPMTFKTGR